MIIFDHPNTTNKFFLTIFNTTLTTFTYIYIHQRVVIVKSGNQIMATISGSKKEKLANAILYFAERIPNLTKTKLLKLLYLLEETYIRKYKIPMLDIDFSVWQRGPVNEDVYFELTEEDEGSKMFSNYFKIRRRGRITSLIPIVKFSDDEFSDNEMDLMELVYYRFGYLSAEFLIDLLHRPNSPWYITAKENGLLELFEQEIKPTSDIKIDFERFFCQTPAEIERFKEQRLFNALP